MDELWYGELHEALAVQRAHDCLYHLNEDVQLNVVDDRYARDGQAVSEEAVHLFKRVELVRCWTEYGLQDGIKRLSQCLDGAANKVRLLEMPEPLVSGNVDVRVRKVSQSALSVGIYKRRYQGTIQNYVRLFELCVIGLSWWEVGWSFPCEGTGTLRSLRARA